MRCDQCGAEPGECTDGRGNLIGDCYDHHPETCTDCLQAPAPLRPGPLPADWRE